MAARKSLYRHRDVALLRAAVARVTDEPDRWPDLGDAADCQAWLVVVWARSSVRTTVRLSSMSLADQIDAICAVRTREPKRVRQATMSLVRYLLRAVGRPTPFGMFAGVAPVEIGASAQVRWGQVHRPVARVTTEWLSELVDRFEACTDLLVRLDVVTSNLAVRRGARLELPTGPNRVTVSWTPAVEAVWEYASVPVRVEVLTDKLVERFAGAARAAVMTMVSQLVRQGFLITSLRPPYTVADPLTYVVDQLWVSGAATIDEVRGLADEVEAVLGEVRQHNDPDVELADALRESMTRRMRSLSTADRVDVAVDTRLDGTVRVPYSVAQEMERAATVLLRLTRNPAGEPAWHAYRAAFVERYGIDTMVPLSEVVDPDAGLGFPAGYPRSALAAPVTGSADRDGALLALATGAMVDGSDEIVLTDEIVDALTDDRFDDRFIPPHVELAGRVHAVNVDALNRGDFTITVSPARSAGTLTSRFTPVATGSGLDAVYRTVPTEVDGAVAVQLSFPPVYPHAENVCRVPAYLPDVLGLGEHRTGGYPLADLAVTATRDRLHLVSLATGRVVEPQVFHALALDKQAPPLARFLAHLPRGFSAGWYQFDWGPHESLPFLPAVRYGRVVLSPARWRLTSSDLPLSAADDSSWLARWRRRWRCPVLVELRDADRSLRLRLDEPAHVAIVRAHARRHGQAILVAAPPAADYGWLDGHGHEIAVPLVRSGRPAPPPRGRRPRIINRAHGQLPGSLDTLWLYAKVFANPERHDEIIAEHLPVLLATVDGPTWWFVRYRSTTETDHLRLRFGVPGSDRYAAGVAALGAWVERLRELGVASRLVIDTYRPEIGRYAAMRRAEMVFAADSELVATQIRHPTEINPTVLIVANMIDLVSGVLGDRDATWRWLAAQPVVPGARLDRALLDQVSQLVEDGPTGGLSGTALGVADAWSARADCLAAYRDAIRGADANRDNIVESLLHMHHNRARGIDPDSERLCRRLARAAALSWQSR